MAKTSRKEAIELAEEHVRLAQDLIHEEAKNCDDDSELREFNEAEFALERAESEIEDVVEKKKR